MRAVKGEIAVHKYYTPINIINVCGVYDMGERASSGARLQLLRNLREFYPIKVDEIVLISAVQKVLKEVTADQIVQEIHALKEQGYVEVS